MLHLNSINPDQKLTEKSIHFRPVLHKFWDMLGLNYVFKCKRFHRGIQSTALAQNFILIVCGWRLCHQCKSEMPKKILATTLYIDIWKALLLWYLLFRNKHRWWALLREKRICYYNLLTAATICLSPRHSTSLCCTFSSRITMWKQQALLKVEEILYVIMSSFTI